MSLGKPDTFGTECGGGRIAFGLVLTRAAQNRVEGEGTDHEDRKFTGICFRTKPPTFVGIQGEVGNESRWSNPGETGIGFAKRG